MTTAETGASNTNPDRRTEAVGTASQPVIRSRLSEPGIGWVGRVAIASDGVDEPPPPPPVHDWVRTAAYRWERRSWGDAYRHAKSRALAPSSELDHSNHYSRF